MNNKEQVPAIHRYKIGVHLPEWGMRSSNPGGIQDASGSWVRYEDHVAVIAALRARIADLEAELAAARRDPVGAVSQWDGVVKSSDFIVDTFRSGSTGWDSKPYNCVRITHRPTGFFEEESATRSDHTNKAVAWQRLSDRLVAAEIADRLVVAEIGKRIKVDQHGTE